MFPGEFELLETPPENQLPHHLAKESLRALHCRLMLLWCSRLHARHGARSGFHENRQSQDEMELGSFALRAWSELPDIEGNTLAARSCSLYPRLATGY
jgi:hypothetical protein